MWTLSDDEAADVYGVPYGKLDKQHKRKNKRKFCTGVSNIDNEPELELTNTITKEIKYFETYVDLHKYLTKIKYLSVSYGYFKNNTGKYLEVGPKDEVQHVYSFSYQINTISTIEEINLPVSVKKGNKK